MDELDHARIISEMHLEHALDRVKQSTAGTGKVSALFCKDCEDPIPDKRRELVPGCIRCRDCQAEHERGRL